MKQKTKHLLIALALMLTPLLASAQVAGLTSSDAINGVIFTFTGTTGSPGTAVITGIQLGDGTPLSTGFTGTLTIPAQFTNGGNTYNVTAINNSNHGSTAYPLNIFGYHTDGTLVTLDLSTATNLNTIGAYSFINCTGLKVVKATSSDASGINLPSSVTALGGYVFQNCSSITAGPLNLGGVTATGLSGGMDFYFCQTLNGNLTLPSGLTGTIGQGEFDGCSGFNGTAGITIPTGVTALGGNVFTDCSNITGALSFTGLHDMSKGNDFYDCYGFTGDVTIPASVTGATGIGAYEFFNTNSIRSFTLASGAGIAPNADLCFSTDATSNKLEYVDLTGCTSWGLTPLYLNRTGSFTGAQYLFYDMLSHTVVYLPSATYTASIKPAGSDINYVSYAGATGNTCTHLSVQSGYDYFLPYGFTAAASTYDATNNTSGGRSYIGGQQFVMTYLPFPFTLPSGMSGFSLSYFNKHGAGNADDTFVFTQLANNAFMANVPYLVRVDGGSPVTSDFNPGSGIYVPASPVGYNHTERVGVSNPNAITHFAQTGRDGSTPDATNTSKTGAVAGEINRDYATDKVPTPNVVWTLYGSTETIPYTDPMITTQGSYGLFPNNTWHPYVGSGWSYNVPPFGEFLSPSTAGAAPAKGMFGGLYDLNGNLIGNAPTGIEGITDNEPANNVETRIYNIAGQYMGKDINALPKGIYIVNGKKVVKN